MCYLGHIVHQYTNTIYIQARLSVNNVTWLKMEYEHCSVRAALSGPIQMTKEPQEVEPWIRKQPPFLWLSAELMNLGASRIVSLEVLSSLQIDKN